MPAAPTLKTLAESLGLSPASVSRALNGSGRLSPATRARVRQAAEKLHYRPNTLARSIRAGHTGLVGLVYSSAGLRFGLPWRFLSGVNAALAAQQRELIVGEVPAARLAEPEHVSGLLRHWTADGLLIFHQVNLPPDVADLVERAHVTAVWVNTRRATDAVYFDDVTAAREAVERLHALGHRRIAYFDAVHAPETFVRPVHYSQIDRLEGYRAAMKELGLRPIVRLCEQPTPSNRRVALVREWLSGRDRPGAVITYGDCEPVLFAAHSLGLKVPADLSVIQFHSDETAMDDLQPARFDHPFDLLGREAVALLARRLRDRGRHHASVAVPFVFREGDTCAPPSTKKGR